MPPFPKVSDVPLTEDVIVQPKTFSMSFLEYLRSVGEEVIVSNAIEASHSLTLFVVPKNFIFFLTSVWMTGFNASNVNNVDVRIRIDSVTGKDILVGRMHQALASDKAELMMGLNPSPPMQFEEGRSIHLTKTALAGGSMFAGISGFQVKKDLYFAAL